MAVPLALSKPKDELANYWQVLRVRRDLWWIFGSAVLLNVGIWAAIIGRSQFNAIVPLGGLGVITLNLGLTLVLIRKEAILTQALALTAAAIQLLLIIMVIRVGIIGF